jgi:hypothetical protein
MSEGKKKFKDTKIGALLKDKAPDVLGLVGDLLPDSGALGIAKKAIDKFVPDEENREALKAQMAAMESEYLKDRQDARDMQKVALQQGDAFSKRFIYIYSYGITAFACIYFMLVTFIELPEGSQHFADIILGFLLGTAISAIVNFFFGTSDSEKSYKK